ncbi:MAG: hypothetical protein ASARMPREDX12_000255 [Alectoria sarmentosa]|nr:MAG: hypothetical protein ASARMPREDX12_000255 [Alectoria sarmentosa]
MATPTTAPTPEQLQALLNGPAGTPPTGVVPRTQNPPNLNAFLILTLTLVLTFGTLAVFMRMYTKLFIIRSVACEDYAVMLGWTVPPVMIIRHGGGSHMWDIQLKTFFDMLYWANLSAILYYPILFFVKLSILLQYLRIFVPNKKGNMSTFVATQVCIWSCFATYLVATISAIAQCTPREKIWNPLMTTGHCIDTSAEYVSIAIFNVITDFAILILPMPSLWKLQMPMKKKILTTAIFATGSLACVTSILRTYYAWQIVPSHDISYNLVKMGFWTYAEIAIGTIVSCMPVLPKFFRHFSPRLYATFASISKPRPRSRSSVVFEKPRNSAESSKKLFIKGSQDETGVSKFWNQAYHPSAAEVKDEYLSLDGYDAVLPRRDTAIEPAPKLVKGSATRRDDLERGQDDFAIGGTTISQRR